MDETHNNHRGIWVERRSVGAVVGAAAEKRPFFTGPPYHGSPPTGGPWRTGWGKQPSSPWGGAWGGARTSRT